MAKLNNALDALLPKKVGTNCPADFRPITMIHSFAKLISKILSLRLAPRLNKMVDTNQNVFIHTWSIHDNFRYIQSSSPNSKEEGADATPETGHLQGF
jgi:hypothetical protein